MWKGKSGGMETKWDEVFMDEVRWGGREREKVKCHKMFGDRKR
jgi:hypothetical protein